MPNDNGRRRRFDHVGLSVQDLDSAVSWYCRAFDMTIDVQADITAIGLRFVMLLAPDGFRLELLHREGSAQSGPRAEHPADAALTQTFGHVAFEVDDVDGTFDELVKLGARVVLPPGPSPVPGRMAWVCDPEENLIELLSRGQPE